MSLVLDGFWLPKNIRKKIITSKTEWITQRYEAGHPTERDDPGIVGARYPILSRHQWKHLLALLASERLPAPPDFLVRMGNALTHINRRFNDPHDFLTITALSAIPAYTGYSPEMIQFTLGTLDMMPLDSLGKDLRIRLPFEVMRRFVPFQESDQSRGKIRFYRSGGRNPWLNILPRVGSSPFPTKPAYPRLVLGYAAGNVMGTSQLISLLAQLSVLVADDSSQPFPVILIKNSRQEPIFTPLLFSALEEIDPMLTATVALMLWDYDDAQLQEYLISQSDLVVAAAADDTIKRIDEVVQKGSRSDHPIRFHRHGHKVSFSTIAAPYLTREPILQIPGNLPLIRATTLLSALDSIYWDQYGCLSSRVHFVEKGGSDTCTPLEYGHLLVDSIRYLSKFLPRGAIPLQGMHTRFEKYTVLATAGQVHVCSGYEDDFLVVVDQRSWKPAIFQNVINDCVERTIIIRPVEDIHEVPDRYLRWLPSGNLQTMSVAIDGPSETTWSSRFSAFVASLGRIGVTGIRTIGRGPFPQLAYSWDGYLPQDFCMTRPNGYFTTVEFENTYQQILDTYEYYTTRSSLGGV